MDHAQGIYTYDPLHQKRNIGRRTGKPIRKKRNGMENFDDYLSDTGDEKSINVTRYTPLGATENIDSVDQKADSGAILGQDKKLPSSKASRQKKVGKLTQQQLQMPAGNLGEVRIANPLAVGSRFGRRTGKDILAGKKAKMLSNGMENFSDFFSDSDVSCSIQYTPSQASLHISSPSTSAKESDIDSPSKTSRAEAASQDKEDTGETLQNVSTENSATNGNAKTTDAEECTTDQSRPGVHVSSSKKPIQKSVEKPQQDHLVTAPEHEPCNRSKSKLVSDTDEVAIGNGDDNNEAACSNVNVEIEPEDEGSTEQDAELPLSDENICNAEKIGETDTKKHNTTGTGLQNEKTTAGTESEKGHQYVIPNSGLDSDESSEVENETNLSKRLTNGVENVNLSSCPEEEQANTDVSQISAAVSVSEKSVSKLPEERSSISTLTQSKSTVSNCEEEQDNEHVGQISASVAGKSVGKLPQEKSKMSTLNRTTSCKPTVSNSSAISTAVNSTTSSAKACRATGGNQRSNELLTKPAATSKNVVTTVADVHVPQCSDDESSDVEQQRQSQASVETEMETGCQLTSPDKDKSSTVPLDFAGDIAGSVTNSRVTSSHFFGIKKRLSYSVALAEAEVTGESRKERGEVIQVKGNKTSKKPLGSFLDQHETTRTNYTELRPQTSQMISLAPRRASQLASHGPTKNSELNVDERSVSSEDFNIVEEDVVIASKIPEAESRGKTKQQADLTERKHQSQRRQSKNQGKRKTLDTKKEKEGDGESNTVDREGNDSMHHPEFRSLAVRKILDTEKEKEGDASQLASHGPTKNSELNVDERSVSSEDFNIVEEDVVIASKIPEAESRGKTKQQADLTERKHQSQRRQSKNQGKKKTLDTKKEKEGDGESNTVDREGNDSMHHPEFRSLAVRKILDTEKEKEGDASQLASHGPTKNSELNVDERSVSSEDFNIVEEDVVIASKIPEAESRGKTKQQADLTERKHQSQRRQSKNQGKRKTLDTEKEKEGDGESNIIDREGNDSRRHPKFRSLAVRKILDTEKEKEGDEESNIVDREGNDSKRHPEFRSLAGKSAKRKNNISVSCEASPPKQRKAEKTNKLVEHEKETHGNYNKDAQTTGDSHDKLKVNGKRSRKAKAQVEDHEKKGELNKCKTEKSGGASKRATSAHNSSVDECRQRRQEQPKGKKNKKKTNKINDNAVDKSVDIYPTCGGEPANEVIANGTEVVDYYVPLNSVSNKKGKPSQQRARRRSSVKHSISKRKSGMSLHETDTDDTSPVRLHYLSALPNVTPQSGLSFRRSRCLTSTRVDMEEEASDLEILPPEEVIVPQDSTPCGPQQKALTMTPRTITSCMRDPSSAKSKKGRRVRISNVFHHKQMSPAESGRESIGGEGVTSTTLPSFSSSPVHYAETTGDNLSQSPAKTLKVKLPDLSYKIIRPGDEAQPGLRRSKRTRVQRLNSFKGEGIVYRRDSTGFGLLVDGVQASLGEAKVRAIEEARKKKLRQRKMKAMNVPARTKRRLSTHKKVDADVTTSTELPVTNPDNNEHVVIELIARQDSASWFGPDMAPVTGSEPIAISLHLQQPGFTSGEMHMRPLAQKDSELAAQTLIFHVVHGKICLTINDISTFVETGDHFFIPRGTWYSLSNTRRDIAKLCFVDLGDALSEHMEMTSQLQHSLAAGDN